MPVVFGKLHNHWDQHGESLVLIGFENVQEIVILKEAHSSIGHLKMNSANASDNPLEKL